MAPTQFDSCDCPEVKEPLGSSASPAGDERRQLLEAKEESNGGYGRWRRSIVQQWTTREADLRQRLDDKETMMAEVLKQASDCEEKLEDQRRAFEQRLESSAAENAKLQQQLNRMGADSCEKEKQMAEVLKQASDCKERLEDQRRAFEDQVENAAAENDELQKQLNRMSEDSSAKEQKMAAVLKQIEATHLKRREEISERMQHKPRLWKNASEESSTNVSEGSSTPGSSRSSNFSSPGSSSQRLAENEELQRRLERLREHCGKDQVGNEQFQKQSEQLRQDHMREQAEHRELPKDMEYLQRDQSKEPLFTARRLFSA